MYGLFPRQSLRRRIIALAAAYAIALSGLIASFGAASMAAQAAADPGLVLCHGEGGAQPAAPADQSGSKTCIDNCCTGCLTTLAALPPSPAIAAPLPQTAARRLPPPVAADLPGAPAAKSHRSRAPPLPA